MLDLTMKTGSSLPVCVWAVLAAGLPLLSPARAADPALPVRVLLFSGQNNHDWHQTTPRLRSILEDSGRFAVEVNERPDQCDAATFARYQAIVSDWNTFPSDAKIREWPAATRAAFLDFIRNGGGHVVVHSGSSSFADWPEYRQLSGSAWGKGTGHGPIHTFVVKPVGDHPIVRGLGPFHTTDELWHRAEVQPRTVLATAFSAPERNGSGQDEPVALLTEFRRGRGFTLLLGHDARAMEAPGFQALLLRGTEWAATGTVGARELYPDSVLDAALGAVAAYRFGDDRRPLAAVEELTQAAFADAALQQKLAAKCAAMLTSAATVEARQFAAWQLSLLGASAEVPALARALSDPNLSYHARLALERIPGKQAQTALETALASASGHLRVDLIGSLAARGNDSAVPTLGGLVAASDPATATAALRALGRIGGGSASALLLAAEGKIPAALEPEWSTALLQCAQRLLTTGNTPAALAILDRLTAPAAAPRIRLAAFPLRVQALGDRGADAVLSALASEDPAQQAAAIGALRATANPGVLSAAADRVDRLPPELQAPMVALLGERGDDAALPAVTKAAASPDAAVRRAAVVALGTLGDAATTPVLAGLLAAADKDEARLIVEAFARLRGAGVDEALVAQLRQAAPAAQLVLIRALVARAAKASVPALLEAAASADASVRREALGALETLGDRSATAPLVAMLERHPDPAAIESALVEIGRRDSEVDAVVAALPGAPATQQIRLLGVLGAVGGPRALAAVRSSVPSPDAAIRAAAVRALAAWPDGAPLDDLARLGATEADAKLKTLALRGIARLAPLAKDQPADRLAQLLDRAVSAAGTPERKALLGALAEVPSPIALKTALAQLENPELVDEASLAALRIVEDIGQDRRVEAREALSRVEAACKNPAITGRLRSLTLKFGDLQNLCLGATASSPDNIDPDGAAGGDPAGIDGKPETYWDEADNQKLYRFRVQFPRRSSVVLLRIMGWKQHDFAPKDFEVICDGQVVKTVVGATYTDNWYETRLPPTACSAVELKITDSYGPSPAIRELELYGNP